MRENFICFEHVTKKYISGEVSVTALDDVSFSISQGEICVIVGESGAGKNYAFEHSGRYGQSHERQGICG